MEINEKGYDKLIILDLQELKESDKYNLSNDIYDKIDEYSKKGINKRVYSIIKWYNNHPGGSSNLDLGIESNKYYMDLTIQWSTKPIDLFINKDHGEHVINTYLLRDNEYVKYVGYLK